MRHLRSARRLLSALALATTALLLSTASSAGTGHITPGSPSKLNLTVYFEYEEADIDRWRELFEQGSIRLYDATDKQLQLGRVRVYPHQCAVAKERADVRIVEGLRNMNADALVRDEMFKAAMDFPGFHIRVGRENIDRMAAENPGLGLAHEIGHYAFNMRDEYKGQERYQVGGEAPFPEIASLQYCSQPGGQGLASIMQAGIGIYNHRTEFCTESGGGWGTDHNAGHVMLSFEQETPPGSGTFQSHYYIYINDQQLYRGRSQWEQLRSMGMRYGLDLQEPSAEPVSDATGHQSIEWTIEPCPDTVVLVLDRSASMDGARLDAAKTATYLVTDIIKDGTEVGVVVFNDTDAVLQPLHALDDTVRQEIRTAVAAIVADQDTNIGGALQTALDMLRGRDPREGVETVILMTDGEHNTGTDPSVVIPEYEADGVVLLTIGFGDSVDIARLAVMSADTGGPAQMAPEPDDLPEAMLDFGLEAQGSQTISSHHGSVGAGQSQDHDVWVDEYTDEITVAVFAPGASPAMGLRDPSGGAIDAASPNAELVQQGADVVALRITAPATGSWTLTASAPAGADYVAKVYGVSSSLSVTASVSGMHESMPLNNYPHPADIRARVLSQGAGVTGAAVTAEVKRPDGTVVSVPLHDDGHAGHADEVADDGSYGARFLQYSQGSHYSVRVRVDGHGAVTSAHADGVGAEEVSQPVAPFQRETTASFAIAGFGGGPSPGSLRVDPLGSDLVEVGSIALDSIPSLPLLGFQLVSGHQEYLTATLRFVDLGDGDLRHVAGARLYVDGDRDGQPDLGGDWADPIGTATVDADDRSWTFSELSIPAGENLDLLLAYDLRKAPAAGGVAPVPKRPPWLPSAVLLSALLGAYWLLRERWRRFGRVVAAGFTVAVGAVALPSCSGEDEPGSTPPFSPETYQVQIQPAASEAVGATTLESIAVEGEPVTGPQFTLR